MDVFDSSIEEEKIKLFPISKQSIKTILSKLNEINVKKRLKYLMRK